MDMNIYSLHDIQHLLYLSHQHNVKRINNIEMRNMCNMIQLRLITCSYSCNNVAVFLVVFWNNIINVFSFHNDNNGENNNVRGRDGNTSRSNNNSTKVIDIKSVEPLTSYRVCVTGACFVILFVTIEIISLIGALNYDPLDIDDDGMKFLDMILMNYYQAFIVWWFG